MGALDKTKQLIDEVKRLGNKSLEAIANDAYAEVLELQGSNLELKEKLLASEKQAGQKMISDGYVLWSNERKKSPEDGPFCPGCWGIKNKAVHLRSTGVGHWFCMGCQQGINEPGADSGIRTARWTTPDDD